MSLAYRDKQTNAVTPVPHRTNKTETANNTTEEEIEQQKFIKSLQNAKYHYTLRERVDNAVQDIKMAGAIGLIYTPAWGSALLLAPRIGDVFAVVGGAAVAVVETVVLATLVIRALVLNP